MHASLQSFKHFYILFENFISPAIRIIMMISFSTVSPGVLIKHISWAVWLIHSRNPPINPDSFRFMHGRNERLDIFHGLWLISKMNSNAYTCLPFSQPSSL